MTSCDCHKLDSPELPTFQVADTGYVSWFDDDPSCKVSTAVLDACGLVVIADAAAATAVTTPAAELLDVLRGPHSAPVNGYQLTIVSGVATVQALDAAGCSLNVRLTAGCTLQVRSSAVCRWTSISDSADAAVVSSGSDLAAVSGSWGPALRGASQSYDGGPADLIPQLCAQFYTMGWVTGTGGSISIRHGARTFMAPSAVQKERMHPDMIFVLDPAGAVLRDPGTVRGTPLKLSQCAPLFQESFNLRNAGACIHSHDPSCVLATLLKPTATEFRITHQEMIKGILGHGFEDTLVVPIIENTPHERDLAASLHEAILMYPRTTAVLVRRHGVYVWGPTWESAKTQAECYHYLFDMAVRMHQLHMDPAARPAPPSHELAPFNTGAAAGIDVVLWDIEGTITPISFVADKLFPYAHQHVRAFLTANWHTQQTQQDVAALLQQNMDDVQAGVEGAVPIDATAPAPALIDAIVANVHWQMSLNRKAGPLKALQGHIWKAGYEDGTLKGDLFEEVPRVLRALVRHGVKVFIYSSGSVAAQQLLFQYSIAGDLRPMLSGYFDTAVGAKGDTASYTTIAQHVAVAAHKILFVTDVAAEATAALAAGLRVRVAVRPGNAPLPGDHTFKTISTMEALIAD